MSVYELSRKGPHVHEDEGPIRALIRESGLGVHIQAALNDLLQPSVRLRTSPSDERALPIGASRLGGDPDLPPGFAWPETDGRPLSFIAQISLAEVAPFDLHDVLPRTGLLTFFYDAVEQPWGGESAHRERWRTYYLDQSPTGLTRHAAPATLAAKGRFAPCTLSYSTEWTLPPFESPYIEELGISFDTMYSPEYGATPERRAEGERLIALFERIDDPHGPLPAHRLMGFPDPIQGDMQGLCEAASHNISESGLGGAERAAIASRSKEWRLLLQVDTDDDAGMMWGDVGRIYFWILRQALAAREFERVWLVLQCC